MLRNLKNNQTTKKHMFSELIGLEAPWLEMIDFIKRSIKKIVGF